MAGLLTDPSTALDVRILDPPATLEVRILEALVDPDGLGFGVAISN